MTSRSVYIQAHAKLNLTLDILKKRPDGYHDIQSLMQSISLHDKISLTPTSGSTSIYCSHPEVPCDSRNLVWQAAMLLKEAAGVKSGVQMELVKGIPVAAGLGGGSADAAAVLRGLNVLWNTGLNDFQLRELAKDIGADVSFCLSGGTVLAEGTGERLTSLKPFPRMWLVLFKPAFGVSTAEVYEAYDRRQPSLLQTTPAVLAGIEKDDFSAAICGFANMLQSTTSVLYPEVGEIINALQEKGVKKVLMCGSGPTVCAVSADKRAAEKLKKECTGFNGRIYITHTVSQGSILLKRDKRGEEVGRKKTFAYTLGKL